VKRMRFIGPVVTDSPVVPGPADRFGAPGRSQVTTQGRSGRRRADAAERRERVMRPRRQPGSRQPKPIRLSAILEN